MRTRHVILAATVLAFGTAQAFAAAPQWKNTLKQAASKLTEHTADKSTSAVPAGEAASGLKEALAKGVTSAINSLGKTNGFWDNKAVRIPLPGGLDKVAKLAEAAGQGDKVQAFQLSLNHAAEKAVPQVADIFGDAIKKMNLKDAEGILTGGDHAATDYFKRVASSSLAERIKPIVAKETSSVGVTEKYKAFMAGSTGSKVSGLLGALGGKSDSSSLDLDQYVTNKAIDGLFTEIGNEEAAIRTNPAARTTDLLKKVFGK